MLGHAEVLVMNHPHSGQPGLPLPVPSHNFQPSRSVESLHNQRSESPRQSNHSIPPPSQATYITPHATPHTVFQPQQHQQHAPYVGTVPSHIAHHPGEPAYFPAHPSPYSTHSAPGSYASSEPNDNMATAHATISRQAYPPISTYQTPQSNSPASMHSPQTDAHARGLYGMHSIHQPMYYQPYHLQQTQQQPPQYGQHSNASLPSMPHAPGMLMSHTQPPQQPSQPPNTHQASNLIDTKSPIAALQRPSMITGSSPHQQPMPQQPPHPDHHHQQQQQISHVQGTPTTPSNPAPGPIPATTPLVVRQDSTGVQWISFEYSRDRVKLEYQIRCDVESVNVDELSQEFKSANCVYPRACCGKEQYKGNRLHYESECNTVGWALASLNPTLREKRGLIQRAVDSWRNSNQDPRLRSRRVRRMAKLTTRNASKAQSVPPGAQYQLPPAQGAHLMHPGHPISAPSGRSDNLAHGLPQMHQHHTDNGGAGHATSVSAANDYHYSSDPNARQPSAIPHAHLMSPATPRYTQSFHPTYPQAPIMDGVAALPHQAIQSGLSNLQNSTMKSRHVDEEEEQRRLFGDVPEEKRRKIIFVESFHKREKCRVQVTLDQAKLEAMPDSHLMTNAVFPRSYFPRTMVSPTASPRGRISGNFDDDDDEDIEVAAGTMPSFGKTLVQVPLLDGNDASLPIPRMSRSRRRKEEILNEMSQRMCWIQTRLLSGKTILLQRSLDAYRARSQKLMADAGIDEASMPSQFRTRPGKRRWLERSRRLKQK